MDLAFAADDKARHSLGIGDPPAFLLVRWAVHALVVSVEGSPIDRSLMAFLTVDIDLLGSAHADCHVPGHRDTRRGFEDLEEIDARVGIRLNACRLRV